ncbi:hypothetical protein GF318_05075 [Candidatus Micrarchaeota archaeon]|nr:hypothetical protein [Candidatus Micrarchaeota archaeon]
MRHAEAVLNQRKPVAEKGGMKGIAGLQSSRARTSIADVVSLDRKKSDTGLYVVEKRAGVKPLERLGDAKGRKLLAKTDGLTSDQKKDLGEQGVSLAYVRELPGPPGLHGVQTSEKYEGEEDNLYGTHVYPYLVVTGKQAESIRNMASRLPKPEEKKPVSRPSEPADPGISAVIMYRCAMGGC